MIRPRGRAARTVGPTGGSMATCLITGGAGNIACRLSHSLARSYERVVLLDVAPAPLGDVGPGAVYERGDVCDDAALEEAFARHRPAAVVHLASLLSASCEADRPRAWRVNMDGTFAVLEAGLRHGRPTVLFTSSVAAMGGGADDVLTDATPQWPGTLYGVTKMAVERLGTYYHARHGLDFRCVRLPITVSRDAPAGAASALASRAFLEAARSGRFTFQARPDRRLAIVAVRDVVAGLAGLLAAPAAALTRRVYSIGGQTTTPAEIAAEIRRRLPGAEIGFAPDAAVDAVLASWPGAVDDTAARRDWGWQPRHDLAAMADELIGIALAERGAAR